MTAGDMSMLLAIVAGIWCGVVLALLIVRGNGPTSDEDDAEQIAAVSKPAPRASINWDDEEQLRKDGLL